jgi:serine/threonine protein kinase
METQRRLVAGRYELRGALGRGGMGRVYAAWDRQLHREVAVKLLPADSIGDGALRRRIEAEARAAAGVVHPNVVTVFDSGEDDDGDPFIVMEKLDGGSLADALARGPMGADEVRAMATQVLAALSAAHARGVIHRDVKPSNILAAAPGRWKVADFGIAKSADASVTATAANEVFGSPAYVSPERVAGLPGTERSDLYAVGVVMYEALAGRKPFDEHEAIATAMRIREGAHEPLWVAAPGVDRVLAAVIERAMALEPGDRYGSAAEMAAAVRGTADTIAARPSERTARMPAHLPPRGRTWHRSSRVALWAALAALVIVAVVTLGALAVFSDAGAQPSATARRSEPPASAAPAPLRDALNRLERAITP